MCEQPRSICKYTCIYASRETRYCLCEKNSCALSTCVYPYRERTYTHTHIYIYACIYAPQRLYMDMGWGETENSRKYMCVREQLSLFFSSIYAYISLKKKTAKERV